jgi:hypothetical protein
MYGFIISLITQTPLIILTPTYNHFATSRHVLKHVKDILLHKEHTHTKCSVSQSTSINHLDTSLSSVPFYADVSLVFLKRHERNNCWEITGTSFFRWFQTSNKISTLL